MFAFGYNPENYGGRIWWNEQNPQMRAIWGTQEDYDKYIKQGGTWEQYAELANERLNSLREISEETEKYKENTVKKI